MWNTIYRKVGDNMSADDNSIENSIKDQLIKSMKDTSKSINIHSTNGIVLLSGCINTLFEKNRAEQIAHKTDGVKAVKNDITISLDGYKSDKDLTKLANEILTKSEFSSRLRGVTAEVSGGSALLVGSVSTERDRQLAISEVQKTYGLTSVVSTIKMSVFKDDPSLTNDVNQVLMQSKINVNEISASIVRGKVTLTGYVEKDEDINALVTLIQSVPGIESVSNKLELRRIPSGIV